MTMRAPDIEGIGHTRRLRIRDRERPLSDEELGAPWRAWKARLRPEDAVEWPAGLDRWFIHAPGAHPLWDWHTLSGCMLRDFPGLPAAKLWRPSASHEFDICAVNPDWQVVIDEPGKDDRCGRFLLQPPNMTHQVCDLTDEMALELQFLLVRAIVTGLTSPDDDFKAQNADMLESTAVHLRQGLHLPS